MSLSPYECAIIIIGAVKKKEKAKGKKITRFQLSLLALTKISKRHVVNSFYLKFLTADLLELGWCMFQVENTRFAFIRASSVNSWVKFSSKKMDKDVEKLIKLKTESLATNDLHNKLLKLKADMEECDND